MDKKNLRQKRIQRMLAFSLALLLLTGCGAQGGEELGKRNSSVQALATAQPIDQFITANEEAVYKDYEDMAKVLESSTETFFQLLRDEKHDTVFSPLSLQIALSMLREGSTGRSKEALDALLKGNESSLEDYKNLLASVQKDRPEDQTYLNNLVLVNPATISDEAKMKAYAKKLADFYCAEVYKANFDKGDQVTSFVHDWVDKNTKGLIEHRPEYEPQTMLVLLNSIYFKGEWRVPFEESNTDQDTFYTPEGEKKQDLMHLDGETFDYRLSDRGTKLILPLGVNKFMVVFMPKDWNSYVKTASLKDLRPQDEELKSGPVVLTFPKFLTKGDFDMMNYLGKLGLDCLLETWENEVGLEDAQLGSFLHKTCFESAEEGVEAAAITEITEVKMAEPEPLESVDIRMDHPFIYGIFDSNGIALFLGQYTGIEK